MNSLQRFLIFVATIALATSGLYFWKAFPSASEPTPHLPAPSVQGRYSSLAQIDQEFQQVVQQVTPSVVSITAEKKVPIHQPQSRLQGILQTPPNLGSGVIVSNKGYVVTNLHVIENAHAIQVQLFDGNTFPATIIGTDALTDIAILKIPGEHLQALPFGNSDTVRPGAMVFAMGNPYGLQETVTQGIISGIGRRSTSETVNEFFQTDTAINPGNSGGPLLNIKGEIIGINNAIHTQSGGWQGISFAIPANTVKRVFEDILKSGRVIRTWLGVAWGRTITPALANQLGLPNENGVLIQYTIENSPAAKAGIQAGDVITEFNGKKITDGIDLRNRVAEISIGQIVPITLIRNGHPMNLKVRFLEFSGK